MPITRNPNCPLCLSTERQNFETDYFNGLVPAGTIAKRLGCSDMTIVNHFRWHTGDDGGARYRTPEALAIRAARQKELVLKDGRIDQIPFLSGITAKLYQRWLALMRLSPGQDPKIEAEIIALSNQIRENVELLARFDPLNKSTFDQGDLPLMYQVIINILKPHPEIMRKVEEGFSKIAFNPGEGVKQDGPIVDTGTGEPPKE